MENILEKISSLMPKFSKGQKKLAEYIINNYDTAAFMTAAKLGEAVGVSESTAVRFADILGYDGYPKFQEELRKLVKGRLNSLEKIEIAAGELSQSHVLEAVMKADAEKIKLTLQSIDQAAFLCAADLIDSARTIYVVGIRSCACLASFFSFYLSMIYPDVRCITTTSLSEVFEQMININEQDVVVGISFPRYSMRTLKCMEFANNRNAQVISITDSRNSPMCMYSSCILTARSDMASIVDSLVAPLSVINSLIVALCLRNREKVVNNMETLEKIWEDYQAYQSDEINFLDENIMDSMDEYEDGKKNI